MVEESADRTEQAAEELEASTRTIRRYIATGRLAAMRVGPRLIRVDLASLEKMTTPVGAR
ncbi:helix-turn-helix domain-containing protein [Mycobacterium sp. OTB74]|uniref:helix-turn-helix domain-containing protein n=1 Tax=Mycobacterium sp. OTB74 TaxID=1853452 RepID=UPI002473A616|nr:helix-turn-helix domain-containing protein [Mycobacterium sp. OTB74]